jgi:hypothetical protein
VEVFFEPHNSFIAMKHYSIIEEYFMKVEHRLKQEIQFFDGLWEGGYYEGDPLDPMGSSRYGVLGYISFLYAIYLTCIKPYINEKSVVCEIGSGRGAWTKTFLKANEIWCLDALSAEHNKFWEYVGKEDNVKYIQVSDFSCNVLPSNKFNYLFSFGCFCHISFEGITEYMKNIYNKLVSGAHCFIMVADYDKHNMAISNKDKYFLKLFPPKIVPFIRLYLSLSRVFPKANRLRYPYLNKDEDKHMRPGRWYHAGIDRTCEMLENLSYEIIEKDVNVCLRDPIIHFTKK